MITNEQAARLGRAIHEIRPDWPAASITTFLLRECPNWTHLDLAVALAACAASTNSDGSYQAATPRYVLDPQWREMVPKAQADWAAKERAARQLDERRQAIAARLDAIADCRHCNTQGRMANGNLCAHNPQLADTARRGATAARAAIRPTRGHDQEGRDLR